MALPCQKTEIDPENPGLYGTYGKWGGSVAKGTLAFQAGFGCANSPVYRWTGHDFGKLFAHGDGAGEFDRGVAAGGAEHAAGTVGDW